MSYNKYKSYKNECNYLREQSGGVNKYNYNTFKIIFNKNTNETIANPNVIDIIFYHENCADGTLCSALWLYNNRKYGNNTIILYPIQPLYNIMSFIVNGIKKYRQQMKENKELLINFVFLDVIPRNIIQFISNIFFIKKRHRITFTIIDHHIGNTNDINKILAMKKSNIFINFTPDSKYGAAKQIVDLLAKRKVLSKIQLEFIVPIAAMDMWNKDIFPDVNNLNFGIKYYCFINNIKMFTPEEFILLSYDGLDAIKYFVNIGKKWYDDTTKYIIEKFSIPTVQEELKKYVVFEKYYIGVINMVSIFNDDMYIKQRGNLSGVICLMLEKNQTLKNKIFGTKVNTLAFLNGGGVSLRIILQSNPDNLDMNYLAEQICDGGGHVTAAGCNMKVFNNYFKI